MQNHDAATPQAREMTLQESVDREHAVLVANLSKPGADIIAQLTPEAAHLWYMASCICGEAGELFDAVKKQAIYGRTLDIANVVEELGDIEFYMQGLRAALGIHRVATLRGNLAKLYAPGYFRGESAAPQTCICGNGPCLAESNGDASQCARREQP